VLGVLGCLVYSHMKRQRRRRIWSQERTYGALHSRNISDASASEDGVVVRALAASQPVSEAPDTAASLTTETIDRLCPQMRYFKSLAEFQESLCTVCLGEYLTCRFEAGQSVRKTTCKHVFHTECLDSWLLRHPHPRCPV